MTLSAIPVVSQWSLSFGNTAAGIVSDSILFYIVALSFLTFLGIGTTAAALPRRMCIQGWTFVPLVGLSLFIAVAGVVIAVGGTIRLSLIISLLIGATANAWALSHPKTVTSLGPFGALLNFAALSVLSYSVTALSMLHNDSLAYVGGQGDVRFLVPLTEWLRDHPAL